MSDVLDWSYSSGDSQSLFYPMNGTGSLGTEGYGQFLPIAAADWNGADSVTVMPASSYNTANCRNRGNVQSTLSTNLDYDERKADFIDQYLEDSGIEVETLSSGEIMDNEDFWNYLTQALNSTDQVEVRNRSPLPDWMADKSVDANVFLNAASQRFPVTQEVYGAASGFQGSDLYLPLHAAEASVAYDLGLDAKLGIASEDPFDKFTEDKTGFPAVRSQQTLDLSGENITPYSGRSDPSDQVLINDSAQNVLRKVSGANQKAVEQVEEIAEQLEDEAMRYKLS